MTLFSFLDNQKGKGIVLVLQNPLYNLWNHFLSLSAILLQALVCRFIKTCPVTKRVMDRLKQIDMFSGN